MSHIFDALQKSEAERGQGESPSLASELLRLADGVPPMPMEQPDASLGVVKVAIPEPQPAVIQRSPELVSPFDQFESLPIVLIPDSKLVSVTEKDGLAAEKFRFLAVQIRHLQQSKRLKTVLITSTIPEEGKSTVAANLACTLARRKQNKTLLLDGDFRRPTLEKQLGLGRLSGLSECLQGSANLVTCIYRLDALGLWILPAGRVPQNPLELMQSGRLSPLMNQLKTWFDWIVIDSPPVLPLADTSVWARLADGIVLVARRGTTEKRQLKRGLEALDQSKLIGALVNGSSNVAQSDYYYRYGPQGASSTKVSSEK